TVTNGEGFFTLPLLPPGTYTLRAEHEGFAQVLVENVVLNVGDQKTLQIKLKTGDVKEVVNVTAETPLINESPAVATIVDRQFVENMPLNGRSFQTLFRLTPGTVLTKTAEAKEQGQFSVNGQRGDTNYFTIDGVSANISVSTGGGIGQANSGSLPGLSAPGGTKSLGSVDAFQEFKIPTSTYSPSFGRQPGGQISIATRSGTNDFHGTLFEYFRNDVLDANDWFANANRLSKPAERQNDFGGVIGGPLLLPRFGEGGPLFYSGKNRTFFFFSYEGLRLRQPQVGLTEVPSLCFRGRDLCPAGQHPACPAIQPLLNALPQPNGQMVRNGVAQFNASFSNPSSLDATSIRIDHAVNNRLTLFGRYNHAPSDAGQRGSNNNASLSVLV